MEDDGEYELCGTALHEAELLKLGNGDIARGQLVYAQRELERAKQAFGNDDPRLAVPLWSLADVYEEMGRVDEAEPLSQRAHELTASSGPNSQLSTRVYGYALRLSDRGKHLEAVPLYESALKLAESVAAADAMTMLLGGYAEALRKVGRSAEAEAAYRRILDLARERSRGAAGAFSIIAALQGVAESQGDQGRFDDAESCYEGALNELVRLVGENGWKVAELLDDWAKLRRRAGLTDQAHPLEVRALRVFRHHLSQVDEEDTHDPEIQNRMASLTSRIAMANRKAASSERPALDRSGAANAPGGLDECPLGSGRSEPYSAPRMRPDGPPRYPAAAPQARRIGVGAALAAALAGACGGRTPPPPREFRTEGPPPEDVVRQVVRDVTALRGLREKRPIVVRAAADDEFAERYLTKRRREARPKDRTLIEREGAERLLGFYDEFAKEIVVRARPPAWSEEDSDPRDLLAHEAVHALQDQHFGIPDLSREPDDDAYVARLALLEGDAQLVTAGYTAKRQGRPPRRAMVEEGRHDDALSIKPSIDAGLLAPSLGRERPTAQMSFSFPYLQGVRFASTLYRTGGFSLINQAHASPPRTTGAVLHPEQYLAGLRPVEVGPFAPPPGARVELDAPLGELGLGSLLMELGTPQGEALERARGIEGARACVGRTASTTSLALATHWQGAEAAARFETWARGALRGSTVAREGRRVALVLGYPDAGATAGRLLGTIGTPPEPEPPFGRIVVPELPPEISQRPEYQGTLSEQGYENPSMGLSLPPPHDARPSPDRSLLAQFITSSGGIVGLSFVPFDYRRRSLLLRISLAALEAPGVQVGERRGARTVATPLGEGEELVHELSVSGRPRLARLIVAPACGGLGSYLLLEITSSEELGALDRWHERFHVAPGATFFCRALEREAREDLAEPRL